MKLVKELEDKDIIPVIKDGKLTLARFEREDPDDKYSELKDETIPVDPDELGITLGLMSQWTYSPSSGDDCSLCGFTATATRGKESCYFFNGAAIWETMSKAMIKRAKE